MATHNRIIRQWSQLPFPHRVMSRLFFLFVFLEILYSNAMQIAFVLVLASNRLFPISLHKVIENKNPFFFVIIFQSMTFAARIALRLVERNLIVIDSTERRRTRRYLLKPQPCGIREEGENDCSINYQYCCRLLTFIYLKKLSDSFFFLSVESYTTFPHIVCHFVDIW